MIPIRLVDTSKAKRLLGFSAHTPLEEGLKKTLAARGAAGVLERDDLNPVEPGRAQPDHARVPQGGLLGRIEQGDAAVRRAGLVLRGLEISGAEDRQLDLF